MTVILLVASPLDTIGVFVCISSSSTLLTHSRIRSRTRLSVNRRRHTRHRGRPLSARHFSEPGVGNHRKTNWSGIKEEGSGESDNGTCKCGASILLWNTEWALRSSSSPPDTDWRLRTKKARACYSDRNCATLQITTVSSGLILLHLEHVEHVEHVGDVTLRLSLSIL